MKLKKTEATLSEAVLDRSMTLEIVRVTERQRSLPQVAWQATRRRRCGRRGGMRAELGKVHVQGRIVIGEGERDEAPMLYIGEEVGAGTAPTSISPSIRSRAPRCAKNQPDSICVLAMAERGGC